MCKIVVRTGKVSEINYEKGTVKVVFEGLEDYQSQELQVLHRKTKKHKTWDMPDIDEEVLVLFLSTGAGETGFVVGSFYNTNTPTPATDDRVKYIFEDGTYFEYDKKTKQAKVDCQGDIIVNSQKNIKATAIENIEATCKNAKVTAEVNIDAVCTTFNAEASSTINLTAPTINLIGTVNASKSVNVANDVITAKGSVNGHTHPYTWAHDPGASNTAPMNG